MNIKLNKYDFILLISLIILSIISIIMIKFNDKKGKIAVVYYDNKIIKKIDLSINKTYTVKGYNGNVKIIVKNNKIKVDSEKSPLHLCSKQGYISKSYETIVCLPNKIVIEIDSSEEIDTVVK